MFCCKPKTYELCQSILQGWPHIHIEGSSQSHKRVLQPHVHMYLATHPLESQPHIHLYPSHTSTCISPHIILAQKCKQKNSLNLCPLSQIPHQSSSLLTPVYSPHPIAFPFLSLVSISAQILMKVLYKIQPKDLSKPEWVWYHQDCEHIQVFKG